jgi:hypothetical protein
MSVSWPSIRIGPRHNGLAEDRNAAAPDTNRRILVLRSFGPQLTYGAYPF